MALQKDCANFSHVSLRWHSEIKTMRHSQLSLLFINRFITSHSSPLDWRLTLSARQINVCFSGSPKQPPQLTVGLTIPAVHRHSQHPPQNPGLQMHIVHFGLEEWALSSVDPSRHICKSVLVTHIMEELGQREGIWKEILTWTSSFPATCCCRQLLPAHCKGSPRAPLHLHLRTIWELVEGDKLTLFPHYKHKRKKVYNRQAP